MLNRIAEEQAAAARQEEREQAAASNTERAREDAETALGEYETKVDNHRERWAAENRGQYDTVEAAIAAWETAWESSEEGQEAEEAVQPYLANYSAAVQHELRVAAVNAGTNPESVQAAVDQQAGDLKTQGEDDTFADTVLNNIVDGAATQVNGESPELREARIEVHELIGDYQQAQTNLNNVLDRRDSALQGVQGIDFRQDIRDSFSEEVAAAQEAYEEAAAALQYGLTNELSIAVADGASPEQIDAAMQSVLGAHPELLSLQSPQGIPFAMEVYMQAEALKFRPEIDQNMALLPSIAADPDTPQWMKDLIASDPASAALVASLEITGNNNTEVEIYSLRPEGASEEELARQSPLLFALLKYSGGTIQIPESDLENPVHTEIVRYGQEAIKAAFEELQDTDEGRQRIGDLQLLIIASGNVRIDYLRGEWERTKALESPEQSLENMIDEYLEQEDFNNLEYTPDTEVGEFMKTLSINMQASNLLMPGHAQQIWAAIGGDIENYIREQAEYLQTQYGDEMDFAGRVGEWQLQWAQFAPQPAAEAVIDVTVSQFSRTLIGQQGGGRMTDGVQLLADRAGQEGADTLAEWAIPASDEDAYSVPIRDLLFVKEDGTGVTLGQALLTELASDGADPYELQDMQSWYEASVNNALEKQNEQVAAEQVRLFNEERNETLQEIFDNALRDNGDVFTQRLNFGTDPASDNEYGRRLELPPDNPDAGDGEALYTDPAKLEKIHLLKQIDWISRGANLPVDLNTLIPLIARGDPLPDDENLGKINDIRNHIRNIGGDDALITFTPAVYESDKIGVTSIYLIHVEGDKNNDGVITRDKTTVQADLGPGMVTLEDEDMIIDATAIAQDDNSPWRYTDFENFQKDNRLDDKGRLYLANTDDLLLHDYNGDGHVDNINFEGVDAAITTPWQRVGQVADYAVGGITALATIACFTPLAPIAAPIAIVGGSYLGARSVVALGQMHEHGQSWASKEGALHWGGVVLSILPVGAGGLRAVTLARAGVSTPAAMRTGFGAMYTGRFNTQLFPASPDVLRGQLIMAHGGRAFTAAKGIDIASMGLGVPQLGVSLHDTVVYWDQMSGLDRAMGVVNIASGVYGTGMGARGLMGGRDHSHHPADGPEDSTTPQIIPATAEYSGRDVANMTAAAWNSLTAREIGAIPADHMGQIAVDQIAFLSTDTIAAFTGDQVAALPPNRLRRLTAEQIAAIPRENIARIPPGRITALTPDQFASMTREQQGWLTLDQLAKVTPDQLAAMTPEQLGGFTAEQRGAFSPRQTSKLSADQADALNAPWLQTPLGPVPIAYEPRQPSTSFRNKPWHQLTREEFASVSGRRLADLPGRELARIRPEVFAAITREQQLWLTPDQCSALTADQLAALTPDQLGAFTREQRAVFTERQLRTLDEAQAGALTWPWLDLQFGPRSMTDVTPNPTSNEFNPVEMLGLPSGRAASPFHEVSHFSGQRAIHVLATSNGVEVGGRVLSQDPIMNIMLLTGFSVAKGKPETDGPPGTAVLGLTLQRSGRNVTFVTDRANEPILRAAWEAARKAALEETLARRAALPPENAHSLDVEVDLLNNLAFNAEVFRAPHFGNFASRRAARLLDRVRPDAVMAVELPGRSVEGNYKNMRGVHISGFNPPLDAIVLEANRRSGIITLGVGDGGNEAGMGVVRDLVPPALDGSDMASNVPVDHLITATVSNWGAVGTAMAFARIIGRPELTPTWAQHGAAIKASADAGAVDGVTRLPEPSVDGFSWEAHQGWHIRMVGDPGNPTTITDSALANTAMDPVFIGLMDSSDGALYAARMFGDTLVEMTGRRLVRVMVTDTDNAPYGPIAMDPTLGTAEIGRLTRNGLRVLSLALQGTTSRLVIAMACNTACTGDNYNAGLGPHVHTIDLVDVTAEAMVRRNPDGSYVYGDRPVSLSTGGTEAVHAYRDAVGSLDGNVRIHEIGASDPTLQRDLADIVNRMNTPNKPTDGEIEAAVDFYVQQMPDDATSVWLTCTHYPALADYIRSSLVRHGLTLPGTNEPIPVVNPMEFQVRATIEALGIEVVQQRPADFQRSRPPVVITSGRYRLVDGTGQTVLDPYTAQPRLVRQGEVQTILSDNPGWRAVKGFSFVDGAGETVLDLYTAQTRVVREDEVATILHENPDWRSVELTAPDQRDVAGLMLVDENGETVLDFGTARPAGATKEQLDVILREHPDWSVVDDQLASARAVLEREDVRVVHVRDFSDPSHGEIVEARHAVYRANNPQDGTLHVLSVKRFRVVDTDGNVVLGPDDKPLLVSRDELRQHNDWQIDPGAPEGEWVPVEVIIRRAEVEAYKELDKQLDGGFRQAYENVLRSIAGYGPVELTATGSSPTPTPAPTPSNWRVAAAEYGPFLAATTTLAATVPPQYLTLANGAAWILRGLGTVPLALWPNRFAANTKAGRLLRAWNGMTFIGNGAYHNFTYGNGAVFPANQLYAVSDHGSMFQNMHEARTGNTNSPPKWARLGTLGFANAANIALMPAYSIGAGFEAWGPNILFGGGTAYLTYKAMGGSRGNANHSQVATGAIAVGLLAFGTHYVLRVALPLLNGDQSQESGMQQPPQTEDPSVELYQERDGQLVTRLDENVWLNPWGRVVLALTIPDNLAYDPDLMGYVEEATEGRSEQAFT
ncbi:MAG: glutamate cyclase domain-containing protein [Rhodomicrobiaceae bacterium]